MKRYWQAAACAWKGHKSCAASPGIAAFHFHPVAAPAYSSPEAASTMWSKKLLPASQSVIMFVNRIEFASISFPDRFPPAVS